MPHEPSSTSAGCALVVKGLPIKEYRRLYRLKNRARLTAQRKAWMTPEKEAEYAKRYYAARQEGKRRRYHERPEVAAAMKARVARWIESNRDKHRNHQMKSELAKRLQCSPSDIPQDFIELKRAHINLQTELAKLK